jgi:hypothetical protein
MTKKPRTPRTAAFKKKVAIKALRLASEHGIHLCRWQVEKRAD